MAITTHPIPPISCNNRALLRHNGASKGLAFVHTKLLNNFVCMYPFYRLFERRLMGIVAG